MDQPSESLPPAHGDPRPPQESGTGDVDQGNLENIDAAGDNPRPLVFEKRCCEIDKTPDSWIVRFTRCDLGVVLQLKIRQYSFDIPAELVCEARVGDTRHFTELARFDFELLDLLPGSGDVCLCDFPPEWRNAYVGMARLWATLNCTAEFAPTPTVRPKGGRRQYVESWELIGK
jgi:hypothetical protein